MEGRKTMQEIRKGIAWDTISHAENTQGNSMRLLIDWVTCSFTFAGNLAQLLQVIGLEELEVDERAGARYDGYIHTYFYDRLEIYESPQKDEELTRRYMLNFSGQACRIYEQHSRIDWRTLFAVITDNFNATFTRLDIAIDDFKQIYKTSTIRQAVKAKLCVTRLADWGDNTEGRIAHGDDFLTMDSFYLGNKRSSRYFLNIYDKKLERQQANKEVTVDSWTRTELRLKAEYATRFATVIAEGNESLGYYTMSFINEKIQFLKPSKEGYKNKGRSAKDKKNVSRWWNQFLGECGKLNLSQKAPDKTLEQVKEWFYKNMCSTLAMVADDSPNEFNSFITETVALGREKYKDKHNDMLENSRNLRGQNSQIQKSESKEIGVVTDQLKLDKLKAIYDQQKKSQRFTDR